MKVYRVTYFGEEDTHAYSEICEWFRSKGAAQKSARHLAMQPIRSRKQV